MAKRKYSKKNVKKNKVTELDEGTPVSTKQLNGANFTQNFNKGFEDTWYGQRGTTQDIGKHFQGDEVDWPVKGEPSTTKSGYSHLVFAGLVVLALIISIIAIV
jgi:hypothetical protein